MKHSEIEVEKLTSTQVMRKVLALTKKWLREKEWNNVQVRFIRGTYHFTNSVSYWITASEILQAATGLEFENMGAGSMAKLKNIYNLK